MQPSRSSAKISQNVKTAERFYSIYSYVIFRYLRHSYYFWQFQSWKWQFRDVPLKNIICLNLSNVNPVLIHLYCTLNGKSMFQFDYLNFFLCTSHVNYYFRQCQTMYSINDNNIDINYNISQQVNWVFFAYYSIRFYHILFYSDLMFILLLNYSLWNSNYCLFGILFNYAK